MIGRLKCDATYDTLTKKTITDLPSTPLGLAGTALADHGGVYHRQPAPLGPPRLVSYTTLVVSGDLDAAGLNVTVGPFATLNISGDLINAQNLTVAPYAHLFIGGDAHIERGSRRGRPVRDRLKTAGTAWLPASYHKATELLRWGEGHVQLGWQDPGFKTASAEATSARTSLRSRVGRVAVLARLGRSTSSPRRSRSTSPA